MKFHNGTFKKFFFLLAGLRQFVQWEPSDTEKDILLQNPKRRKVETTSTIGKILL